MTLGRYVHVPARCRRAPGRRARSRPGGTLSDLHCAPTTPALARSSSSGSASKEGVGQPMTVESELALAVVGQDQPHDRRRPRAMPTAAPCSAPGTASTGRKAAECCGSAWAGAGAGCPPDPPHMPRKHTGRPPPEAQQRPADAGAASRTDLDAEVNRSRRGTRPISAKGRRRHEHAGRPYAVGGAPTHRGRDSPRRRAAVGSRPYNLPAHVIRLEVNPKKHHEYPRPHPVA